MHSYTKACRFIKIKMTFVGLNVQLPETKNAMEYAAINRQDT